MGSCSRTSQTKEPCGELDSRETPSMKQQLQDNLHLDLVSQTPMAFPCYTGRTVLFGLVVFYFGYVYDMVFSINFEEPIFGVYNGELQVQIFDFSSYKYARNHVSINLLLTISEIINKSIQDGGLNTIFFYTGALKHFVDEGGTFTVSGNKELGSVDYDVHIVRRVWVLGITLFPSYMCCLVRERSFLSYPFSCYSWL